MKYTLTILLLLLLSSCATQQRVRYHTPCNPDSPLYNTEECQIWAENYTQEYKSWRMWIRQHATPEQEKRILSDPANTVWWPYVATDKETQ